MAGLRSLRGILGVPRRTSLGQKCLFSYYPVNDSLYGLSSELIQLRETVFNFAKKEIAPYAAEGDESNAFPGFREKMYKLGQMGLLGMTVPAEFGGSDAGYLAQCIATEELSRASASFGALYCAHTNLSMNNIVLNGTTEQKERFLPKMCSGELLGAVAISETTSGSDAVSMKLHAERQDGNYRLNGTKTWISNGPEADILLTYATTDSTKKQHGITAFIVEADSPGFNKGPPFDKLGLRAMGMCQLFFDDCIVPESNVLGGENKGVYVMMRGLDYERLNLAAPPLGIQQACCDVAFEYAHQRKQFGKNIGEFQLIQGKMADMYVDVNVCRSLLYNVARACDRGAKDPKDCAAVILLCAEKATKLALDVVQILGGNGYINDYPAGRLLRDAKGWEIAGGTSEIRRLLIGRAINAQYSRGTMLETRLLGFIYFVIVSWVGESSNGAIIDYVEVETEDGRLRGKVVETFAGNVTQYLGIPYVAPPIGERRFGAPENASKWNSTRNATAYGDMCPQDVSLLKKYLAEEYMVSPEMSRLVANVVHERTSEDCLTLNIFAPVLSGVSPRQVLPVMLYIHGGSFLVGSGMLIDGSTLAIHGNAIVITMNYRLGVLGFLSTGDSLVRGNMGFLDQLEAMHWIKRNIAVFGGDPDNVTIFGDYSGAISVNVHILSPLSKGWFDQAICMSGIANFEGFNNVNPAFQVKGLAENVNCPDEDTRETLQCLKEKSVEEFTTLRTLTGFKPLVDGLFLPKYPSDLRTTGQFNKVPYIIGTNLNDASFSSSGESVSLSLPDKESFEMAMTQKIRQVFGTSVNQLLKDSIIFEYSPDTPSETAYLASYMEAWSDFNYIIPTITDAINHVSFNASTFVYLFTQRSSFWRHSEEEKLVKAPHGSFLPYVFGLVLDPSLNETVTEGERQLSKHLMQIWSNFAQQGSPNIPGLLDWPQFSAHEHAYLDINEKLSAKSNLKMRKYRFWTEMIPKLRNPPPAPTADDKECAESRTPIEAVSTTTAQVRVTTEEIPGTPSVSVETTSEIPTSVTETNIDGGPLVPRSVTNRDNFTTIQTYATTQSSIDNVTNYMVKTSESFDGNGVTMNLTDKTNTETVTNSTEMLETIPNNTHGVTTSPTIDTNVSEVTQNAKCVVHLGTVKLATNEAELAIGILFFLSIFLFVLLVMVPIWFAARDAQLSSPLDNNF
ncbi:unnamed protein product [Owenia fusiformis]|uniref:Isobutyryl-CoA dehydrogenase, mitochondrial n=1 Tax=Owenia fusiformis TaxID=6347 RepID=A0A8S4N1K4_OWEFU|nr:unnamed protein product [Owenia fusiformis]